MPGWCSRLPEIPPRQGNVQRRVRYAEHEQPDFEGVLDVGEGHNAEDGGIGREDFNERSHGAGGVLILKQQSVGLWNFSVLPIVHRNEFIRAEKLHSRSPSGDFVDGIVEGVFRYAVLPDHQVHGVGPVASRRSVSPADHMTDVSPEIRSWSETVVCSQVKVRVVVDQAIIARGSPHPPRHSSLTAGPATRP
jgi:hypothetical protein